MSRISTALARVLAVLALAAVALAIYLVISSSVEDSGGDKDKPKVQRQNGNGNGNRNGNQNQNGAPKFYVVQPGDTLTGIAEETGVSIEQIQQLNPGLDPQILNSGQKLRLR